jgi:Family of unknown function (DUF6152)
VISKPRILALAAAATFASTSTLVAHHSWPVDFSKEVTVTGTVTEYDWGNPHVMIALEVRDETGKVEKWNVGGPSTTRMAGNGWDKNTLKMGDVITGTGYRFADGQRIIRLQKVVMPDGKVMLFYGR